jgi:hypothetical protein
MRITTRNPYQHTKNHTNYTVQQIEKMIQEAENGRQYLYDFLIDKLYLLTQGKRNTKKSYEYSFLSARVLKEREIQEISLEKIHNI